ncbi:MAG: hypothetical protein GY789_00465 [Hyphomicrobiales bacterium]|nr:hypothetical protein [Hyphomicrobiales bacterium]
MGLESRRLQDCIDETLNRKLKGVFGRHPEFVELDLNFLTQLHELETVMLRDIKLRDCSAIYELENLEYFAISGKRPAIDFTRLKCLQRLVLEYRRKDDGLSDLTNLKLLHLWRYKAPNREEFSLPLSPNLEELGINWSNVESLEGFGRYPNVKKLEVARCRNLKSLGRLAKAFPKLEHLVVTACGRLTAGEARTALSGHKHIKHAYAGKELIVSSRVGKMR